MNCKPGDLAAIVDTHPEAREMLGRLIRLTQPVLFEGEWCWLYQEMPLRWKCGRSNATWHELPDAWLRPIRPGDISDEEVRDLYAPKIPEAA